MYLELRFCQTTLYYIKLITEQVNMEVGLRVKFASILIKRVWGLCHKSRIYDSRITDKARLDLV